MILTPREQQKALRKEFEKRTTKLRKKLPHNWKLLFIHDNPDYKPHGRLLSDVMSCRSLHLETLTKIEVWSLKLK